MNRAIRNLAAIVALFVSLGTVRAQIVIEQYQAFNLTFGANNFNTTGVYDFEDQYAIGTQQWKAWLLPAHPIQLARGGTPNFLAVLGAAFNTWTFNTAATSLTASALRVHSYDVFGSPGYVGIEQVPNIGFHVEYRPGVGDPTANMHWIQVVTNNHALGGGGGHGVGANIVDNGGAADPFYDTLGAADDRHLIDAPGRLDGNQSHIWTADLYLVQVTGLQTVTIYDGLRWGWANAPVPEPSVVFAAALAGSFILVGISRRRREK